ncbi:hypothetical protein [Paenibacillus periandrae]|uniref:hypothetical protein n=1 Tax=Paenibacillus periandrae TaxID=1761741 RepID=UPI001F089DD5|nr:hypothetical protein [Paenibacillus periandrae]
MVYRDSNVTDNRDEVIDSFDSKEQVVSACKGLNGGCYYSIEHGIGCYVEMAERLHNS